MRALALAASCLALLAGCSDPVRVVSLTPGPAGTFVFAAQTNTVMTANDDGAAELIRRGWLAEELAANGMCDTGYVVQTRRLAQLAARPPTNSHDIVYTGRCLERVRSLHPVLHERG